MKRYILLILCVVLSLNLLTGCGTENISNSKNKISVITTFFPAYDFVRNIGGDKVEVSMLIEPGNEVHTFEPTPQDIINISKCDLFVFNGGASDEWVRSVLNGFDNEIQTLDFISVTEDDEKNHNEHMHDEHVWTSPENAKKIVAALADCLIELDKANETYYEEALNKYTEKLDELDKEFLNIVSNSKRNVVVFGDKFPLVHFADRYDIEYLSAYPGCAEDTEPSAATISELIEIVKEQNIPVIFKIEMSNDNIAKTICEATGAKLLTFHTCHNLEGSDFESGATYISLMQGNAEALREALN